MSTHQKRTLGGIGALVALTLGLIALADNVWARGSDVQEMRGDVQVIDSRLTRVEKDQATDSERIRRIDIRMAQVCEKLGCGD